ncbi:MAG: flippase activity-associated protein Agl23, partial [Candidatus Promineifilaceae bacterium]
MSELLTTPDQDAEEFLSRPLLPALHLDWEKTIYLIFILVAIVSRFWLLGNRVMSHDESLHTQFSYQFYDGQGYNHTPLMHGPFLFHITALSYWLFGDSDLSARLPVAIFGIILIILPYFLRDWLGRIGSLFTSFIFLISPFITYYSRYIRHDIYIIVWAFLLVIGMWHYFRQQKDIYMWVFVATTALMFSTKEVAFIYVAIFGSYLLLRVLAKFVDASWLRPALPRLRVPLFVLLAGLVLIGAGFLGERTSLGDQDTLTTAEPTEGFAVDPNAAAEPASPATESPAGSWLGWLQVAGIVVLGAGAFLLVRGLRPEIDVYPEFDLIILFSTLLLPLTSPLLTKIVGWNPTDYTLSTCQLLGQESMSALQLLLGRMSSAECWSAFLQSGIVRSAIFLIPTLAISILVGLWWDRRRWLISALIFNGIYVVLFTSVFTNLGGWTTGVIGSLGYWLEQQAVQRGSQPPYYYLFIVPLYEFLPLIFSLMAMRLWTKQHRTNKVFGFWVITFLLALLLFSLVNWIYASFLTSDVAPTETTIIPGLATAGLIIAAALLYWFLRYRQHLIQEYDLKKGVQELFDPHVLLEFVPFLVWWLLLTWLAYSYAGEKMPWLTTHFVIPMGMLTGWYFNEKLSPLSAEDLFSRRSLVFMGLTILLVIAAMLVIGPLLLGGLQLGDQQIEALTGVGRFLGGIIIVGIVAYFFRRSYRAIPDYLQNPLLVLSAFILLSALTIRFTYMAAFKNADYTTEFMVYAHGAPATKSVVLDQVEELSMRLYGDKSIKVAFDSDVSWPLTWYLRDYPQRVFFGENPSQSLNDSPVIIVGAQNWNSVEPYLGNNYEYTEHTFLWWPMEEYRNISWNAILGDPATPPESRRGLGNPEVREALWDIFFYRDYEKYGQVFGGIYTAGEWPLRHNLRLYIRNDVLPTMWDYGVGAVAAGEVVDPYAEGELSPQLLLTLNEGGVGGTAAGQLATPRNMAVGPDGSIYVLDSGNHRLQVFDASGQFVKEWGSFGSEPGQFNEPWGIAVDDENVYVADTWNHR